MNSHSFSVELAKNIGLNEAILLQHIFFWHQKNKANGSNIIDGNVWTYNSIKAFREIFPYMTKNVIVNSLKRLVDKGILIEGNHNKIAFDKTKWYSITKIGLIDFLNSEIVYGIEKSDSEIKKPIPDSKTYIYNTYYDEQIEISKNNQLYKSFVGFLFKNNETNKPLVKVLKLNNQISFDTFEKWMKKYDKEVIKRTILDLENYKKDVYTSFTLTIGKWLLKTKSENSKN